MKKTKSKRDIEDIEFIVNELIRFGSMDEETMVDHFSEHENDALFSLAHPKNEGGVLFMGEAAARRLHDLAKRHLATSPDLNNDFEINAFINTLKEEFVSKFLKNGEPELSQRTIDKMLAAAVRRAKKNHKALTHYLVWSFPVLSLRR